MKLSKIPHFKLSLSAAAINCLLIIIVLLTLSILPPEIPLFFSKPIGENQLANKIFLTIPPLAALLFSLINLALIRLIPNKFLQDILIGTTLTITLLSTITVLKIFFLTANL